MKNYIRPSQEKDDPGPGEGLLNSQGGDPGWVRMKVYSEGYTARVRDGLRDVYEAVFHLLGDALRDVLDPKERKNTDENDR